MIYKKSGGPDSSYNKTFEYDNNYEQKVGRRTNQIVKKSVIGKRKDGLENFKDYYSEKSEFKYQASDLQDNQDDLDSDLSIGMTTEKSLSKQKQLNSSMPIKKGIYIGEEKLFQKQDQKLENKQQNQFKDLGINQWSSIQKKQYNQNGFQNSDNDESFLEEFDKNFGKSQQASQIDSFEIDFEDSQNLQKLNLDQLFEVNEKLYQKNNQANEKYNFNSEKLNKFRDNQKVNLSNSTQNQFIQNFDEEKELFSLENQPINQQKLKQTTNGTKNQVQEQINLNNQITDKDINQKHLKKGKLYLEDQIQLGEQKEKNFKINSNDNLDKYQKNLKENEIDEKDKIVQNDKINKIQIEQSEKSYNTNEQLSIENNGNYIKSKQQSKLKKPNQENQDNKIIQKDQYIEQRIKRWQNKNDKEQKNQESKFVLNLSKNADQSDVFKLKSINKNSNQIPFSGYLSSANTSGFLNLETDSSKSYEINVKNNINDQKIIQNQFLNQQKDTNKSPSENKRDEIKSNQNQSDKVIYQISKEQNKSHNKENISKVQEKQSKQKINQMEIVEDKTCLQDNQNDYQQKISKKEEDEQQIQKQIQENYENLNEKNLNILKKIQDDKEKQSFEKKSKNNQMEIVQDNCDFNQNEISNEQQFDQIQDFQQPDFQQSNQNSIEQLSQQIAERNNKFEEVKKIEQQQQSEQSQKKQIKNKRKKSEISRNDLNNETVRQSNSSKSKSKKKKIVLQNSDKISKKQSLKEQKTVKVKQENTKQNEKISQKRQIKNSQKIKQKIIYSSEDLDEQYEKEKKKIVKQNKHKNIDQLVQEFRSLILDQKQCQNFDYQEILFTQNQDQQESDRRYPKRIRIPTQIPGSGIQIIQTEDNKPIGIRVPIIFSNDFIKHTKQLRKNQSKMGSMQVEENYQEKQEEQKQETIKESDEQQENELSVNEELFLDSNKRQQIMKDIGIKNKLLIQIQKQEHNKILFTLKLIPEQQGQIQLQNYSKLMEIEKYVK